MLSLQIEKMQILSNRWPEWYDKLTKADAEDWARLFSGYTEDDISWACWRYRLEHDTGLFAPKFSKFAEILNSRPKTTTAKNPDIETFFVLCVDVDNTGGGDIGRWYSFAAKNENITDQTKTHWLSIYNQLYGGVWKLFEKITRSKFFRLRAEFLKNPSPNIDTCEKNNYNDFDDDDIPF